MTLKSQIHRRKSKPDQNSKQLEAEKNKRKKGESRKVSEKKQNTVKKNRFDIEREGRKKKSKTKNIAQKS